MNVSIDGNKFTISLTLTRFKVVIVALIIGIFLYMPFYALKNENKKITPVMPSNQIVIVEPIVSPFNLTSNTKSILKNWLHYGYVHGYDKMMSEYTIQNGNSETSKMFRYLIDSEWRLGCWEQLSNLHLNNQKDSASR